MVEVVEAKEKVEKNNENELVVLVSFNPEKAYRWIVNTDAYKIGTALQEAELRAYLRFMKDLKPVNILIYALAFTMILIGGIIAYVILTNTLAPSSPPSTPISTPVPTPPPAPVEII